MRCSICERAPLAHSCRICGRRVPRFVCFAVSGSLCNIVQLVLDRAIWLTIEGAELELPVVTSWTVSYTISVSLRHLSHEWFVFGRHADPFWCALGKSYATYGTTIVASTALNLWLISALQQSHDVALAITASFSVLWSFFVLQCTWQEAAAQPACWHSDATDRGVYRGLQTVSSPSAELRDVFRPTLLDGAPIQCPVVENAAAASDLSDASVDEDDIPACHTSRTERHESGARREALFAL